MENKILATFTTVHGARVTVTEVPRTSDYHVPQAWTCDCGTTGKPGFGDSANDVRAAANDHARTCLVTAPTPAA